MAREYVFRDEWVAEAPQEALFDALADARTHPDWWHPGCLSAEVDGDPRVGRISRERFRGRVPYVTRTIAEIVGLDRPSRLEVKLRGDMRGRAVWTLSPRPPSGVHISFELNVFPNRLLLRLLRPLVRWDQRWLARQAQFGLEPYARIRSGMRPRT